MGKRKENESLEAIVKRKTAGGTAIVAVMFLILFIIVILRFKTSPTSGLATILVLTVTALILCLLTFLVYKLLKKVNKDNVIYEDNKKIVMNKLSRSKYTKVIPRYLTEFTDDLTNERNVEFYAILIETENEEIVQVDIKYVTESKYIKYDGYLPGYFLDYYEIAEN